MTFATAGRYVLALMLLLFLPSCKTEKQAVEPKKPEPAPVVIKQKNPVLSAEQKAELGFPDDLIGKVELSAGGAAAEPFFATVLLSSENLKGEKGFEQKTLAGFSVRTKNTDELIKSYRAGLRVKGYLIFKSHTGYGSLPDIVTIVKGNSSYDILKILGTEAVSYHLDTNAIIGWLKQQQQFGSFVITGAGSDWVEARFVKPPSDMHAFAKRIYAFAPDVRASGPKTVDKLIEQMKEMNGFYLVWD